MQPAIEQNKNRHQALLNCLFYSCLALLSIYLLLLYLLPIETEDVWWHLATGRYIWQHHAVPHTDPFVFTDERVPWTVIHWMGSLILYLVTLAGGLEGLFFFRPAVFIIVYAIFYIYSARKIPRHLLIIIILFMSFAGANRANLRPYVFSFIFLQILLIQLFQFHRSPNKKSLLLIALTGLVWSNFHLDSFVYGMPIFLCFLLGSFGLKEKRGQTFAWMCLCLCAYIASSIFNPYGWEGLLYPFRVFLQPDFIGLYRFNKLIMEQQAPIYIVTAQGAWFWGLCGIYIFSLMKNRDKNLLNALLFVLPLFLFIYTQRLAALFAIMAGYAIADNFKNAETAKKDTGPLNQPKFIISTLTVTAIVLLINIIHTANRKIYIEDRFRHNFNFGYDRFAPQKALDLLSINGITGRAFNTDIYGGYLLWHAYPQVRPFVDGRQLNKEAWQAYRQMALYPERFWDDYDQTLDFDIALIAAPVPYSWKVIDFLQNNPHWQLINVDNVSVLFIKAGRFHLMPELANYAQNLRDTVFDRNELKEILKDAPRKESLSGNLKNFFNPNEYFVDKLEEAVTIYDLGYKEAGIALAMESYRAAPLPKTISLLQKMQEGL